MVQPTPEHRVYHFTHVSHLAAIVRDGLLCDSEIHKTQKLNYEAGDHAIKDHRRNRNVPCGPSGVVADYVPFYFAPRSPMLYRITNPHQLANGGVATYDGSPHELIYLVSSVEHLHTAGLAVVLTDRNAATGYAQFCDDPAQWFAPDFIDWPLMKAQIWKNTGEYPERMERRMAECLVHGVVPWPAILEIAVHDSSIATQVKTVLASAGKNTLTPELKPEWYF